MSVTARANATVEPRAEFCNRELAAGATMLGLGTAPQTWTWGCGGVERTDCNASMILRHGWSNRKSQQGEDLGLLSSVFCDTCYRQRTYLELGALDGKKYSNTYLLENYYNWGGLLIEGMPENAKGLIANRGKSGRNVIFNDAICPTVGTVNFTNYAAGGTAGVPELMTKQYIQKWGKRWQKGGTVAVPCRPLAELVHLAGITEIDFFSLDVEGAELLVLQTFDWNVRVKVFCIELDQGGTYDSGVRELLKAHGYVETPLIKLGHNIVFVHSSLLGTLRSRIDHCQKLPAERPCAQADVRAVFDAKATSSAAIETRTTDHARSLAPAVARPPPPPSPRRSSSPLHDKTAPLHNRTQALKQDGTRPTRSNKTEHGSTRTFTLDEWKALDVQLLDTLVTDRGLESITDRAESDKYPGLILNFKRTRAGFYVTFE